MSAGVTGQRVTRRGWRLVVTVAAVAMTALGLSAPAASAQPATHARSATPVATPARQATPTCTWIYPTSPGSPGPSDDACIESGTYAITGNLDVHTMTVFSGAAFQIGYTPAEGCAPPPITATFEDGGTVQSGGDITLYSSSTCFEGGDTTLDISAGTLVNSGTLGSVGCLPSPEGCYGGGRYLIGNVVNKSGGQVVLSNEGLTVEGPGLFDNSGSVSIPSGETLSIPSPASSSQAVVFRNAATGSISNYGSLTMGSGNTFDEAGTTTGNNVLLVGDTLHYTGTGASTLEVQGATTLSGDIATGQTLVLDGSSGFCQITSAAVTAARGFTNAGTITGACGGGPASLTVTSGTLDNTGAISFGYPTSLSLTGNVINTGSVTVGYGETVTYQGGTFTNKGTVDVENAGSPPSFNIPSGAAATFDNASTGSVQVNNGSFNVGSGNTFDEAGTITGSNPLLVNATLHYTGAGASSIEVQGSTTLSGNIAKLQTLVLETPSGFCQIPSQVVTAATGFTNAGTITTACGGGPATINVATGTLTNTGTITGASTNAFDLNATVDNKGLLRTGYNDTLTVSGLTNYDSSTQTLTGGRYEVDTGCNAEIVVPGMDIVVNDAAIYDYAGCTPGLSDGSNPSLRSITQNEATLWLDPQDQGNTLTLSGGLINSGLLTLGQRMNLVVNGALSQTSGGQYESGVAGSSAYGQLRVNGSASLDGTLLINKSTNYTPAVGDTQQVVTYSSESGQFSSVKGAAAGHGLYFVLQYTPSAAELVVTRTKLSVSPASGPAGSPVTLKGKGFSPGETVSMSFKDSAGTVTNLPPAVADSSGDFTASESVPATAATGAGAFTATGETSQVAKKAAFSVS